MIQQGREIDLKKAFYYHLGPVFWSLVSVTGGMVKTKTSTLIHEPEMKVTHVDATPKPFSFVIDGVALVWQSNYIGLTYYEVADKFLTATASGASRIDTVFDVSRPDSIKNIVRGQWSV